MAAAERERVIARIAELRATLRNTSSPDVRQTVTKATADCQARLAELDAQTAAGELDALTAT
jgi:hypothetical protein